MELFFNTINGVKKQEINEIFSKYKCTVKFLDYNVSEILSHEIEKVIYAKVTEAYKYCRVPVIVEHGSLSIEYLNHFPGPLSKPMWDLLGDKICKLIPPGESRNAIVYSGVGYCNGKFRKIFIGSTKGQISNKGKGSHGFQWDPIFIPEGESRTYAEMNQTEKLTFSQAAKAYKKLIDYLKLK